MATSTINFARQPFETTLDDIYTVSTGAIAIVTNIVVVNTSPIQQTFNIELDGVELFENTPIAGNSTISIDMKQTLDVDTPEKKIRGFASSAAVRVHISGVEIV
jgi:hypothetical protein